MANRSKIFFICLITLGACSLSLTTSAMRLRKRSFEKEKQVDEVSEQTVYKIGELTAERSFIKCVYSLLEYTQKAEPKTFAILLEKNNKNEKFVESDDAFWLFKNLDFIEEDGSIRGIVKELVKLFVVKSNDEKQPLKVLSMKDVKLKEAK